MDMILLVELDMLSCEPNSKELVVDTLDPGWD
jgi:hypothetical protein